MMKKVDYYFFNQMSVMQSVYRNKTLVYSHSVYEKLSLDSYAGEFLILIV